MDSVLLDFKQLHFLLSDTHLWAHSCRTITTLTRGGFLIGSGSSQWSTRSKSQGNDCTYLLSPDPLPGWAQTQHLITFPIQSITEAHCVWAHCWSQSVPVCFNTWQTKKNRSMAVANFQYITRMSSGFKVYILEGKTDLCVYVYFLIFDLW